MPHLGNNRIGVLPRHHVASGSFYVGGAEQRLLQAFLGTCIGLALWDRRASVGGLAHFILPEPVVPGSTYQPEKYAATGLPRFLDALVAAGAQKDRLVGTMAGGALVGPVRQQDLSLDIGGRTAEIVQTQLASQGIPIQHSETGGFFTCCLNLNLETGEASIEPAGIEKSDRQTSVQIPSREEVIAAGEKIKPIPQVALKILRIVNDDQTDWQKIAAEIRKDQVISARTLQLCNSAFHASKTPITSLEHALAFVGQNLLVRVVISAALDDFFNQSGKGYSLCKGGLFHHALGAGITAEMLARRSGRVDPSVAYTAGLLHDIGKVVLDQFVASAYPLFYRSVREDGDHMKNTEKRILGYSHEEAGLALARRWELPLVVQEAIAHHHNPESAGHFPEVAVLVNLADHIMFRFNAGLELESMRNERFVDRLQSAGIDAGQLPQLIDAVPADIFGATPETAILGRRP
jgi:putative nucleotidyltransferase with HDIG domain